MRRVPRVLQGCRQIRAVLMQYKAQSGGPRPYGSQIQTSSIAKIRLIINYYMDNRKGNRPQSAKYVIKSHTNNEPQEEPPSSQQQPIQQEVEDKRPQSSFPKRLFTKALPKANLPSPNQFSRIMPKNIHQDKERLYSQTLQLKQANHMLINENMKLKTRIATLQKQGVRQRRQDERWPVHNARHGDNSALQTLQFHIKQTKRQLQALRIQNAKIKRTIKFTKIQQLQSQHATMAEQALRMKHFLEEQINKNMNDRISAQNFKQLQSQLNQKMEENQGLFEEINKLQNAVRYLQQQLKNHSSKNVDNQKKYQRQLQAVRKRVTQKQSQLQATKESLKTVTQQKSKLAKQVNDLKKQITRIGKPDSKSKDQLISQLNSKINQLQKQLQDYKQHNHQSDLKNSPVEALQSGNAEQTHKDYSQQFQREEVQPHIQNLQDHQFQEYDQNFDQYDQQKHKKQVLKELQQQKQKSAKKKDKAKDPVKTDEKKTVSEKDDKKKKSKDKDKDRDREKRQSKERDKEKKKSKLSKQLRQLGELLSLRLKSQRYTVPNLIQSISSSLPPKIQIGQLSELLNYEPFCIHTEDQMQVIMKYIFDSEILMQNFQIDTKSLNQKLKKLLPKIVLVDQRVEDDCLVKINDCIAMRGQQLEAALKRNQIGQGLIDKGTFCRVLKQFDLDELCQDILISQVAIYSNSINQLYYVTLFEKFLEDEDGQNYEVKEVSQEYEQSKSNTLHGPQQESSLSKSSRLQKKRKDEKAKSPSLRSKRVGNKTLSMKDQDDILDEDYNL